MVPSIGRDVVYKGESYHVQDRDLILLTAWIGKADTNGIVWNPFWVDMADLSPAPEGACSCGP